MRLLTIVICWITASVGFGQGSEEVERLYQRGEWADAVVLGIRLLETNPDDLGVAHLVGRALADQKKYGAAIPFLEKSSVAPAPVWMQSWSHGYLGFCYYVADNVAAAKSHLQAAIRLDATPNSTTFAQKRLQLFQMTAYFDDWEMVETEHIRFHVQPGHQIEDLAAYCAAREDAYQQNNAFFEATPYKKVDYFVWSQPEAGQQVIGKHIGFANSELCIINAKIHQTRGHELTHILSDFGVRPTTKNRLINEGVAVAFDLTNRDRIESAKSANPKNKSIKKWMQQADELPESEVYPVGGALITYLLEKGDGERLKKLLKEQTYEMLVALYGTETIEDFERQVMNRR